MKRIAVLVRKELIELRRDPRLFAVVIAAPIVQLFALGYAATTDVRDVPVVVADADQSPESRDLTSHLGASRNLAVIEVVTNVNAIDAFLLDGRAWMAVAIPPGYGAGLNAGHAQVLQVIADGSDANSANIGLGYAVNLLAEYGEQRGASSVMSGAVSSVGQAGGGIEPRVRVWFNPQLESRDFMIPGILALLLLVVTTNLSSMAIVREREIGTLEQLNVTPLTRWELILGKLLPYALVGMIDVLLVLALAILWFHVPMRGSIWLLLALTLVYLMNTLGLGLLVSTVSSTQQQAMMTSMFFLLMPMVYLSGFVFPIENMPAAIQPFTYLIPLRYFLTILRSIFLKGVGLETLWREALALTISGLVILGLAVLRSSKRAA